MLTLSLPHTFEKQKDSVPSPEDESSFYSIVMGQVFSDAINENMIGAYNTGQKLYQEFVEERLKPDSEIGIFAQLKKEMIKTCKSSNKNVKIKCKEKLQP